MWTRALLTQFLEPSPGCIAFPATLPRVGNHSGLASISAGRQSASPLLLSGRMQAA